MRQAFINDILNQLGAMNLSSEDKTENWTKGCSFFSCNYHKHSSRKHQDGLTRMKRKLSCFSKKNTACTRHIKMILALYQRRLPTTIFVRQSKTGTVTCKTAILERWAERFNSVLNRPSSVKQIATDRVQCSA